MYSQLKNQLPETLLKDRHRLKRQLEQLKRQKKPESDPAWQKLTDRVNRSIEQVVANRAAVPNIGYPDNLPVAQKRDELIRLIKDHQVIVIAGETGSGKTTQIPKMCLEAGRGVFGRIGCTQPRRLAARSVAERIAQELDSNLGELVGYQVRFHDQVKNNSLIKVMTDGILLAEVQNDRFLNQYDTIIIDEAHERSINIDFLLGILKTLLPKRPDLKLVITSATIDTERFAQFFREGEAAVPVVEVSGRTYPVEVRYRPLSTFVDDEGNEFEQDIPTAILHAVEELAEIDPFGDVLVFQIGERDIKETANLLNKSHLNNTEVIPLYARQAMSEQNKVFQISQKRRIILATNVAETSLTVPGIKFVIDPGLARISRYSVRSKVQRLPVEKISQASANQRKGRCGRVSNGVCIRLYEEDDFLARALFTTPEIHRTSLATIILQMTQMKLGKVKSFPFIEPPEDKAVNDGFRQLHEIGALDDKRKLTESGRQLAKLPLDPRMAKMVLAGQQNGVLTEVLVIVAAISIQDPRDLNEENRQAASKAHAKWEDERSDFLFFLNLWRFYEYQKRHLSQSKLRKLCKTNYLSYLRMREWHDLFWQLETSLNRMGLTVGELHLYEEVQKGKQTLERLSDLHSIAIHRTLLSGLLGQVSRREEDKSYLGARSTKLFIHPSSVLFKQKPKWLLSGELVETSKLYARNNAEIDVRWIESLAKHLIKHSYADPHWQKKSGQVGAYESITLYGLPIVTRRRCNYGPINPKEARKIFIQSALVNGELRSKLGFYLHNQQLMQEIEKIEHKLRRQDYLVDLSVVYKFYDSKIPEFIYSQPALEKWVRKLERNSEAELKSLYLSEGFLMKQFVDEVDLAAFPDQVELPNKLALELDYQFQPGRAKDGVIFHLPLAALNVADPQQFEWLTPGFLAEKVIAYIKALPKAKRKQFVPAPHYAELVLQEMSPAKNAERGGFVNQLVWALNRRGNIAQRITIDDFQDLVLPSHLQPFFVLQDEQGNAIAEGSDLMVLKDDYLHLVQRKIQQKQSRQVIECWDFGDLPQHKTLKNKGAEMLAYPALQVTQNRLELGLLGELAQAEQSHAEGVRFLLKQLLADKVRYLQKKLPLQAACLCYAPYGTCAYLTEQIIDRALQVLVPQPESIRQQAVFEQTLERVRLNWVSEAQSLAQQVTAILKAHQNIAKRVKGKVNPRWLASLSDIRTQLDGLIESDFVIATPEQWFGQLPRYLQGLEKRLQKIDIDPSKDQQAMAQIQPMLARFNQLTTDPVYQQSDQFITLRWQIEELRLSLFSQPMKTLMPVSLKRISKQLSDLGV